MVAQCFLSFWYWGLCCLCRCCVERNIGGYQFYVTYHGVKKYWVGGSFLGGILTTTVTILVVSSYIPLSTLTTGRLSLNGRGTLGADCCSGILSGNSSFVTAVFRNMSGGGAIAVAGNSATAVGIGSNGRSADAGANGVA